MENLASRIEFLAIDLFEKERLRLRMSEEQLGKAVFPGAGDPRRQIQSIRKHSRKIKLAEFFMLASALGLDPLRVLATVLVDAEKEEDVLAAADPPKQSRRKPAAA